MTWIIAKEEKLKYDDRPTKYFFRKEKQIGLQRQIHSLITKDQKEIDTKTDSLKETQEFYQTLYQPDDIDRRQMHSNLEHIKHKLDQDDRDYLNRPINTQWNT